MQLFLEVGMTLVRFRLYRNFFVRIDSLIEKVKFSSMPPIESFREHPNGLDGPVDFKVFTTRFSTRVQ